MVDLLEGKALVTLKHAHEALPVVRFPSSYMHIFYFTIIKIMVD